jgi:hypothetical protein
VGSPTWITQVGRGALDPHNVPAGIQADVRRHTGKEDVGAGSQLEHGDRLPLQVVDRTDPLRPEQAEVFAFSVLARKS